VIEELDVEMDLLGREELEESEEDEVVEVEDDVEVELEEVVDVEDEVGKGFFRESVP
jgi:hypothetical protein